MLRPSLLQPAQLLRGGTFQQTSLPSSRGEHRTFSFNHGYSRRNAASRRHTQTQTRVHSVTKVRLASDRGHGSHRRLYVLASFEAPGFTAFGRNAKRDSGDASKGTKPAHSQPSNIGSCLHRCGSRGRSGRASGVCVAGAHRSVSAGSPLPAGANSAAAAAA